MNLPKKPGIYVVVGCLSQETRIELRVLGNHLLNPGIYCYCGSAQGPGGLSARVKRHLRNKTKKFWHFDYLKENLRMLEVWWQTGKERQECEIVQFLARQPGALKTVSGFGSSDCRNDCVSHLIYFENMHIIEEIFQETHIYGFDFSRKVIQSEEIG